jgi:hypothetical protein
VTACSDKQCSVCGEVKSTSFFYKHKLTKDGFRSKCKSCSQKQNRSSYEANSEQYRLYAREYHANNREACVGKMRARYASNKDAYRRRALIASYGAGADEFYDTELAKDDKCRICGTTEAECPKGRLAIDHCHETGELRGLLCSKCNTAIGLLGDNCATLESAITYLKSHGHQSS